MKERNIGLIKSIGLNYNLLNLELVSAKKSTSPLKKSKAKIDDAIIKSEVILLNNIFDAAEFRDYLNYNEYDGILYYSKER
ncbi:hypothetical protein, partial [Escherichia coli]